VSEYTGANTFRMDSRNSPFATKSRACASVGFLARIVSWCADSNRTTAVCCGIGIHVQTIDFLNYDLYTGETEIVLRMS